VLLSYHIAALAIVWNYEEWFESVQGDILQICLEGDFWSGPRQGPLQKISADCLPLHTAL
jgi:hypothetical protein